MLIYLPSSGPGGRGRIRHAQERVDPRAGVERPCLSADNAVLGRDVSRTDAGGQPAHQQQQYATRQHGYINARQHGQSDNHCAVSYLRLYRARRN